MLFSRNKLIFKILFKKYCWYTLKVTRENAPNVAISMKNSTVSETFVSLYCNSNVNRKTATCI